MLVNENSNKSLDINIFFAKSLLEKSAGMVFFKNPKALFLKTRFGLHTFFLRFPIDVVILDKEGKTVKFKENLSPNRILLWNPVFENVLELPSGTANKLKIKLGHMLRFNLS